MNDPQDNVVLLDVRSDGEYHGEGKGARLGDDELSDQLPMWTAPLKTRRPPRSNYIEGGHPPRIREIIIYCKTSMRARLCSCACTMRGTET